MKKLIISFLLINIACFGTAQEIEIRYEVRGNYKRTILKENLLNVKTMKDINPGYPSSWISGYASVELLTTSMSGKVLKASSSNDTLNQQQIDLLQKAGAGTLISVAIKYLPEGQTDFRDMNFSYTLVPSVEASFPNGYDQLKAYLKTNAIDKLKGKVDPKDLELVTVTFNVNENGAIEHAEIEVSSDDEKIDQLLLEVVNQMPNWNPAIDSNGDKVTQRFMLQVGYMAGC